MEPEIEPDMEDNINALFGKYELGKLLGCGAFAKVYHARNLETSQSVAIKVFNKKKITSSGLTSHIKREIVIMSRLRHPNIVGFHEVLATKTKIFFVIELVKGGELFSRIAKGRFSEDLSRKYFQQLISAVGYCHSRGVFHRDLKPENLLLDEHGNLKVSDFGLSAVRDQIRHDGLLHTLCGTPAYVAPEILSKKGYDGAKVDVWSCGVILFTLAAGYLPFNDPNLMVIYRKIQKGEFRCPMWMSPELKRFLSRLLDTNPNTRITIGDILQDPWFKQGYKEVKFQEDDFGFETKNNGEPEIIQLNAFDLISFSAGLDLSGLFYNAAERSERFVSSESPEKIMEKVEKVAKAEGLAVRRRMKEYRVGVEGVRDNLGMSVEVYRLTDELVVVEAKRGGVNGIVFIERLWNNRLWPLLRDSVCTTDSTSYQVGG